MPKDSPFEKIYENWLSVSAVDESPKSGIVYHYTDAKGLMGILENGVIFATDYRFLNDKSELSHGLLASSDLCEGLAGRTSDKKLARFLLEIRNYLKIPTEMRSFVASFSEKPDDLSQWRGYSCDGEGFTVGLDARWLLQRSNEGPSAPFGFAKVSYSRNDFRAEISKLIQQFYKAIPSESPVSLIDDAAAWCDAAIETLCAFFKHSSFQSEQEWRIIDHVSEEDEGKKIFVRERGSSLVPFIKIDLKDSDSRIPLLSIGVGPTFANPAMSQVVRDLCARWDYQPKIYNAKTPYQRV